MRGQFEPIHWHIGKNVLDVIDHVCVFHFLRFVFGLEDTVFPSFKGKDGVDL